MTTHTADHDVAGASSTVSHLFRMLLTFCSFGFIYPNSFTEGMDLAGIQQRTQGDPDATA